MSLKNIKYYISLAVLMLSVSIPVKAMELHYFDKDIVAVFNDASLFLLGIVGKLVLLFLVFGGVYYIMSGSDPQKQESAKKIITHSLLGLIFILLSYGLMSKLSYISSGMGITIGSASVTPVSGPPGTIFIIRASIVAANGAVDPTTTIAYIESPDEVFAASIILFDDGAHSDGASGDGVFGNTWPSGAFPIGPYFVDIEACNTEGECAEAENI
jgi:hypothetical protein